MSSQHNPAIHNTNSLYVAQHFPTKHLTVPAVDCAVDVDDDVVVVAGAGAADVVVVVDADFGARCMIEIILDLVGPAVALLVAARCSFDGGNNCSCYCCYLVD